MNGAASASFNTCASYLRAFDGQLARRQLLRLAAVFALSGPTYLPAATTDQEGLRRLIMLPDEAIASVPAPGGTAARPPRLIVLLHGAAQGPLDMIRRFAGDPDCRDAVLLAPKSARLTWDVISMAETAALQASSVTTAFLHYTKSTDGGRVVSAMEALAAQVSTDPAQQILVGFSDGATFALALGTSKDTPFTDVVALSPGLAVVASRPARGRRVLVMHGRQDKNLPFSFTSTTVVDRLKSAGLTVRFVPFEGGHVIPDHPLATLKTVFGLDSSSTGR